MFAGHAALALYAKSRAPRIPIAVLVPVAFAPDWVELFGETFHYYNRELSHSLVSVGIGATLVAMVYYVVVLRRNAGLREAGDVQQNHVILREQNHVILRERSDRGIAPNSPRSFASLRMTHASLAKAAFVLWLTYVSHWPADFITGLKPTWPGGPTVGLFLYEHPLGDFLVESALVVACWLAYTRSLPLVSRKRAINLLIPLGLIGLQIVFEAIQSPDFR